MSDNAPVLAELERLMHTLALTVTDERATGDAITQELASPARTTAVSRLRHAPEVEAFRQELLDGLIRVDTANRLLRLVDRIIVQWMG